MTATRGGARYPVCGTMFNSSCSMRTDGLHDKVLCIQYHRISLPNHFIQILYLFIVYTLFLGIFGNLFPLISLKLKLFMVQIIRNSTVDPDGTAIGLIV